MIVANWFIVRAIKSYWPVIVNYGVAYLIGHYSGPLTPILGKAGITVDWTIFTKTLEAFMFSMGLLACHWIDEKTVLTSNHQTQEAPK